MHTLTHTHAHTLTLTQAYRNRYPHTIQHMNTHTESLMSYRERPGRRCGRWSRACSPPDRCSSPGRRGPRSPSPGSSAGASAGREGKEEFEPAEKPQKHNEVLKTCFPPLVVSWINVVRLGSLTFFHERHTVISINRFLRLLFP